MSNTTWTGSSSTDWATGANWSTGSVPTTGAHIVIPDTSSINNCVLDQTRTIGSLTIQANGTLVGGGFTLNVTSEGDASGGTEHYAVNIDGIISGDLNLNITTADSTNLDIIPSSGNIHDLTINLGDAARIAKIQTGGPTLTGDLTITSGQLSTENNALTVAGVVTNNGTLTLNGSTVNLGSTSAEAGDFQGSGTFNLDTSTINFHTASSANFTPDTSANFDTNTSTLNLIGLDSSTRAHNFTFASGNLHNVTTSRGTGSGTHIDKLNGNCTITGNLTVGANSKFSSGTRVFTVNGDVSVTGELDCDDSDKPMSFGSLTIASGGTYNATSGTTTIKGNASSSANLAWANSGTFTHNSGTVLFDGTNTFGGSTFGHINPATNTFNNLTINADSKVLQLRGNSTTLTVAGDLTITDGTLMNYGTDTVTTTVTGDVSIANGATLGANTGGNDMTAPLNFGTLTVDSGGTFIATSDTTTITAASGAPVNGRCWYIHNGATFTHNNGLCKFTASSPQVEMVSSGQTSTPNPFYDVEQTAGTMQWKGEHTKVLNNATLRGSQFNGSTGNLTVLGICRFTASSFNASDTSTSNHNFFGTLVIESGATVDVSAIDITVGSLRNLGGTIQ